MKTLIIFTLLFFSTKLHASQVHGTLMVVKGDVQLTSVKDKKTSKARVGAKVYPGDTLLTGKESRAKIVMVDKNVINISPDSKFLIEQYAYNPEKNEKGALLNVIYGKVRTTVNQKYDGEKNKFQVKTKSSVAGVRGTDFMVEFNRSSNSSRVVTFEGRVAVGSGFDISGRIMNPVNVDPGQFTVASNGRGPGAPTELPKAELDALNEQSVADAPSAGAENQERQPSNDDSSDEPKEDGSGERSPDGSAPPPPTADGGSVLDEMGEDASAPITGGNMPDPMAGLPPPPLNPCPGGTCTPLNTIDPSLFQGTSNVIIQLNPSP